MSRSRTLAPMRWVLLALTLLACGGEERAEPTAELTDEAEAETESAEAPARAEPRAPVRVRLDLARHLERAETFHGETRVMQLGEPEGHQHTLGGWRTRTGDTHAFDGGHAAVVSNVTGFFVVPIDAPGRCRLTMRARGVADGRVALYLDDETIGNVTLPTDGSWAVVGASIPEALCTPGEHDLRLRAPSAGSVPGVGRAAALVDWMAIGPAPFEGEPAAMGGRFDGAPGLSVPEGWTLAYTFEVPDDARLRALARGEGRVAITVRPDGADAVTLPAIGAGEIDRELTRWAGQVVRLELRAEGALELLAPAIVTPDPGPLTEPRRVRNVIYYLTDTLRADHLEVYEPETRVRTPALTAWAAHGATFLAGHSQENWTKPSCATLLSGLYPWEHRATSEDAVVPASVELVSETLRARGFTTAAFITNGFVSDRFGFDQGWGHFFNYLRRGRRNMARYVADDVLEWLDERPQDEPFFLYVHTIDPHVPYIPPDEDLALYDPDPYQGVVDFTEDRELLEKVKSGRLNLSARDRVHLEALYDGEVTYHDHHFAHILEGLDERGLTEDTLVVFTADHGEEFWDHGSVGHGHSVWEELIRVPLIVRWPGVTDDGMRIDEAVGLVDVAPTTFDALGLEPPAHLSGRSLATLLRGGVEDAPRATATGFMNGWRTVVIGRFKLVQRTPANFMVYDLAEDPGETRDLASERPLTVRYLRAMLGLTLAGAETREAERTPMDAEVRGMLEALGYVGASRAPREEDAE